MLSFNMLIFSALILRIIFVVYGALASIAVIGKENIKFLLDYIKIRALQSHKLVVWIVSFGTLIYFEHLVTNAEDIAISSVFEKNIWLSLIVLFLLFSVNAYAFLDAKNSIKIAKETKKDAERAIFIKNLINVAKIGSWFVPAGWIARIGIYTVVVVADTFFDNHIESKVAKTILKNISVMMLLAIVNATMIIIATYLITDHILFW